MTYSEIILENTPNDFFSCKSFEDEIAMCKNPLIVIPKTKLRLAVSCMVDNRNNPYAYTVKKSKYNFYGEDIDVELIDISYSESRHQNKIMVIDRDNPSEYKIFYLIE